MIKGQALAALSIAAAVSLGALGAHFLKVRLDMDQLMSFETGVRYHLFHSLALLLICSLDWSPAKEIKKIAWLMALGMILFSGSIYLLSTRELWSLDLTFLGPVTPIGGLMMIFSWMWLFFSRLRAYK